MNKEKILRAIKQNKSGDKLLPDWDDSGQTKSQNDLLEDFIKVSQQVGAEIVKCVDEVEADIYIRSNFDNALDFSNPRLWMEIIAGNPIDRLKNVEAAIIKGQVGIAENGAIWVDESNFPDRIVPFIVQQLIIKLPKKKIYSNMHEAYKHTSSKKTGFGVFISGPSKTADIEQSLVYGAHGPRRQVVVLI